jgi:integrase
VRDVGFALGKLAERFSTRSVRLARMTLIQAIRNAMVNDLVMRNVADLAAVPSGKPGRPSRSLDLEQALAVLDAAQGECLWPYVAVTCSAASAPRKLAALRWSEVDLEAGTVAVCRSVPIEQIADAVGPLFESRERRTEAKADLRLPRS